jgi:hypothetical protein
MCIFHVRRIMDAVRVTTGDVLRTTYLERTLHDYYATWMMTADVIDVGLTALRVGSPLLAAHPLFNCQRSEPLCTIHNICPTEPIRNRKNRNLERHRVNGLLKNFYQISYFIQHTKFITHHTPYGVLLIQGENMSGRFDYVKYDESHTVLQELFKTEFEDLEESIDRRLPEGRAKSIVITKLEETYIWIGKAIRDDQIKLNGTVTHQPKRG